MRSERHVGFTLVEVMVVVVILGILAVLIVPRVIGRTEEARAAAAKHDIATIMQSLKLYHLDNGRYPTNEQGLQALVSRPQSQPAPPNWKPYLDKLPNDPWGNPYQYTPTGNTVYLFSYGADGQPGGEGINADVGFLPKATADEAGHRLQSYSMRGESARLLDPLLRAGTWRGP